MARRQDPGWRYGRVAKADGEERINAVQSTLHNGERFTGDMISVPNSHLSVDFSNRSGT